MTLNLENDLNSYTKEDKKMKMTQAPKTLARIDLARRRRGRYRES